MSRFAKIDESVFSHYDQLTGEEYRLYSTIVFHTFVDTGICRKNLRQMALAHGLEYTRTTTRFKKLVKLGWCEKTSKGIRPLVNLNSPKSSPPENVDILPTSEDEEMLTKSQHQCLQSANTDIDKMPTSEDEMFAKSQHLFKGIIEPFKNQNFSTTTTEPKNGVVVVEKNGHQSQFSLEDCLRYVDLCKAGGQAVKNREGLAISLFESGSADAFILAKLYPEPIDSPPPPDAPEDGEEKTAERLKALEILSSLLAIGEEIETMRHWYQDDWDWLMRELKR